MTFPDAAPPESEERAVRTPPARTSRRVVVTANTPLKDAPSPPQLTPDPAPPPDPPALELLTVQGPPPSLAQRGRARLGTEGGLVIGLTVLALLPRLACLDCNSLWRDEIAVLEGLRGGLGTVAQSNVPLYTLQVWLTTQIADPATTGFWLRLPSALAGALTVPVIYALGRLWWGRAEGLLAALLTALAPVLLVYAQDMRAYAELTLFAAAAVYCLIRADRAGEGRWLLAAGVLLGATVLMSRTGLVLVLSSILPFAAWVAGRWWIRRGRRTRAGRGAAVVAGLAVVLGTLLLISQRERVLSYITPFTLPDLNPAALGALVRVAQQQIVFDTTLGFDTPDFTWIRVGLLALMGIGAVSGLLRRDTRQGALVCALVSLMPLGVLTLSSATNIIYPRFALFAFPFGLLLAAHGLIAPWRAILNTRPTPQRRQVVMAGGGIATALLLLPFAAGVAAYYTPEGNTQLAYRPDYRGVVQYLATRVQPNDIIVFVGWDDRVADFYWHGQPPVAAYSALDPRLYRHRGAGAVYWVVSYDYNKPNQFIQSRPWTAVLAVERIVVLREDSPNLDMHERMTRFTEGLFSSGPLDPVLGRSVPIMRGSYFEARGLIAEAVQTYRTIISDEPTRAFGREWLQVAVDDAAAGQLRAAWRAALMAKYHQPDAPEVYRWQAAQLAATGQAIESTWAAAVADALAQP